MLDEEKEKLDKIFLGWEEIADLFEEGCSFLQKFIMKHGRLPTWSEKSEDHNTGVWLNDQRQKFRKEKMPDKEKDQLDKIFLGWEANPFEEGCSFLEKFILKHGRLPTWSEKSEDHNTGQWLSKQRQKFRKEKMLDEEKYQLDKIFKGWEEIADLFEEGCSFLQKFILKHGRLPTWKEKVEDHNTGQWLSKQRQKFRKEKMLDEEKDQLDKIFLGWEADPFEEGCSFLKKFIMKHGRLPTRSEKSENHNIGVWLNNQRKKFRKEKMPEGEKEKLDKIFLGWEEIADLFEEGCSFLKKFIMKHGRLPTWSEKSEDHNTGQWLNDQRKKFRKEKMLDEEKYQLDKIFLGWEITKSAKIEN
jgi:hypothetical protein